MESSTGNFFNSCSVVQKSVLSSIMHYNKDKRDSDESKMALSSNFLPPCISNLLFLTKKKNPKDNTIILQSIDFYEQEKSEFCASLNVNKNKGTDDLPLFFVCESFSISQIFRKIIQMSIFPEYWKRAIINPLYKKDDKSDI